MDNEDICSHTRKDKTSKGTSQSLTVCGSEQVTPVDSLLQNGPV